MAWVLLWAPPARGDEAEPAKAWKELFKQNYPAAATAQIDAVLAACGHRADAIRKLIESDVTYDPYKPGWLRCATEVVDGEKTYPVEFFVRVPHAYTAKKSWPLLLAAHGQGGSGQHFGRSIEQLLGGELEKYVIVSPTMPGPKGFNGRQYQEQAYLLSLTWAKLRVNVDDDRVYMTGYSQGGHCTWHVAAMFPYQFAAVVPAAGVPFFEGAPLTTITYLENLSNLPVWAIWGEKDSAKPPALGNVDLCRATAKRLGELNNKYFKGTELTGVGHGGCWPRSEEFTAFLAAHKREAAPAKLMHFFHLPHHARSYYLQATKLAHEPIRFSKELVVTLPPGQEPDNKLVLELLQKKSQEQLLRMWADADKPANTLTIRAAGILAVQIDLVGNLLDPARPAKIKYWSKTWTGKIPVSARCMLTHYAADRDAANLVCNEMDLDIFGKASFRFESQEE